MPLGFDERKQILESLVDHPKFTQVLRIMVDGATSKLTKKIEELEIKVAKLEDETKKKVK